MFVNRHYTKFNPSSFPRFTMIAVYVGVALLLILTSTASFSQGTVTTLDFPGTNFTAPEDISNAGVVVGFYNDVSHLNGLSHGFLYSNGKFTPYDVPGSISTQIRGINTYRDYVGFYQDAQQNVHGFLRDHATGHVTTLDLFGVNQTFPTGINDQGAIVGLFIDNNNNQVGHYFVYANNQAVQVDIPNTTIATDGSDWPKINNSGSIVGTVNDNNTGEIRAALISNSSWMLSNVNGKNSFGRAINSAGAIAGFYHAGESGFVSTNGTITLIQIPGALNTKPLGISDHQITGAYVDALGTHGFVMQLP